MKQVIGRRIQLLVTAGIVAFTISCNDPSGNTFTVKGQIANSSGQKIMLAELPYAAPNRIVVDSATTDSAGRFQLQTVQSQESIYQLFLVNGPGFLLINDADNLAVTADTKAPEKYTILGSPASEAIRQLYQQFVPAYNQMQAANNAAMATRPSGKQGDSLLSAALLQRDITQQALAAVFTQFLTNEKNATARYFALGMAKPFLPASSWQALVDSSLKASPSHPGLALLRVSAAGNTTQGSHLLNKPVPELILPDTSGQPIAISSFRGRWLLIDCWASWCDPCRKENPNLVKAYRQFSKKNFTILGISLDKTKPEWMAAITKDTLTWTQVSDLQYWDSKAVGTFDIQALPFNLLVDPGGTVKAINLTDTLLLQTLKQWVK